MRHGGVTVICHDSRNTQVLVRVNTRPNRERGDIKVKATQTDRKRQQTRKKEKGQKLSLTKRELKAEV